MPAQRLSARHGAPDRSGAPQQARTRRLAARAIPLQRRLGNRALAGLLLQRDARKGARKKSAPVMPKLGVLPAKDPWSPCACIVFIHHNEPNARLTARLMHQFCRYNLAIVEPETKAREIDLPGKGKVDPNELFPRNVAEQCWDDDQPCEDFLTKNAGSADGAVVEQMAQRQFFLAVKQCSSGFSLPVVALHNNTIEETAKYRAALADPSQPLDVGPIRGKTFDDTLKAGEKPAVADTTPLAELQEWMKKLEQLAKPTGPKGALEGSPLVPGKTNIFLWCSAKDISRCQIGDPERPDNVVWVTNSADFEKLRGTKTNVVLQTRVDPAGRSATDLSSLFVFLAEIMDKRMSGEISKHEAWLIDQAVRHAKALWQELKGEPTAEKPTAERTRELLLKKAQLDLERLARETALSHLRFVNVETPQSAADAAMKPEDLRVQSYRDIRATLKLLDLDCCDTKPAEGETESAVDKVEKALRAGKLPEEAKAPK